MASTVMQEQQPAAAVPDERQSTAPGDATAAGSLPHVSLVGKPLGQLPCELVGPAGPSISSPTPTVGIGAAQSQPEPVAGHMGTCIGLPGFMAFGGPFPGVPMAASMPEGNPLMWAPPAVFPHGMDVATSLMAHMAMTDGGGYAGVPYSGYPLGMSDNEMSMSGALASANMASEGGASPQVVRTPTAVDKRRGPRSSTSKFRGVSCYKRTGRWESHIWSNGKQVHLGSFRLPEEAARAYDMAAICFRGWDCETNFPPVLYRDDCVLAWHMQNDTTEQYIAWLRRGGKEPNSLGVLPSAAEGQGMMAAPAEAADDASLPATDTTGLASLVNQSATDEALQAANPPDAPAAVDADADSDFMSFARELVLG